MRRLLPLLALALVWTGAANAHGLLIPDEKSVPPLAMLNHKVSITIEDQVAITKVDQTFRNHTNRELEATYVFPVPKGAKVDNLTMWVNGKPLKGEIVEADKARSIYQSIVRRTQDPALLEYMGNNLFSLKVFPIPANGEQRVSLQYKSIADKEKHLVEYIYPLKTDGKATATLEEFSITATIKSQHNVTNVYSPTHALRIDRVNDREVKVAFEKQQGLLDKDFQLFYGTGDKDVGLTVLTHRPIAAEKGYFTLLISPKVEIPKEYQVPRDIVMVLDTSGSMRGIKMGQAQKAMKYCLNNLTSKDRFAMINFATSVNTWRDSLTDAGADELKAARKWVDDLEATGGTAINDALARALDFRSGDEGRTFTIVFFTDGQPTIGETNCDKILKNTLAKNTASTRIFTFGVGDDVNASFLDQLAEQTRALSTYVRPQEDIEAKTSALYAKISNPVLANLKLTTTADVRFSEVYPVQLPDLFHGNQLVVMGRYSGKGPTAIKLTGLVGKESKEFVYEYTFPEKTEDGREFVEELWARRKVGFLLDQIRANGQKKELVDEVVLLAKKYGITTPYTSYLIVPDGPVPVVRDPKFRAKPGTPGAGKDEPWGLSKVKTPDGKQVNVEEYAKLNQTKPGELAESRDRLAGDDLKTSSKDGAKGDKDNARAAKDAEEKKEAYDKAREYLFRRKLDDVQAGKLGVDLAIHNANLRSQSRLERTASRYVNGRNCLEVGGVWIDEGFDAKMKTLTIKAQSDAYFKLLEKQPKMREVLKLGNHLLWVTPNGTALIIDTKAGKDKIDDKEIEALFVAKK